MLSGQQEKYKKRHEVGWIWGGLERTMWGGNSRISLYTCIEFSKNQ